VTSDQFRQALETLGLSQVGAAPYLGVDARTIRRWAKDTPIPQTVVLLLTLYLSNPFLMDTARGEAKW